MLKHDIMIAGIPLRVASVRWLSERTAGSERYVALEVSDRLPGREVRTWEVVIVQRTGKWRFYEVTSATGPTSTRSAYPAATK